MGWEALLGNKLLSLLTPRILIIRKYMLMCSIGEVFEEHSAGILVILLQV